MKKLHFLFIAVLLFFIACKNPEDKFQGTWTGIEKNSGGTLIIIKSNPNFILQLNGEQITGYYDKSNDKINFLESNINNELKIDKKTEDVVLDGGLIFEKQK